MLDTMEKEILSNLATVCKGFKGTQDEHEYLKNCLKYIENSFIELAKLKEPQEEKSE